MTLVSTLTAVLRRTSSKANRKTMSRMRRLQRQLKALREEVRAQRRLVAGLERRFTRLKTRLLRTGISGGPGRPITPQSVHALRARLGMPRIEFAKIVGVSPGSIFGWEMGRTLPRARSIARLRAIRKKGFRAIHRPKRYPHRPPRSGRRAKRH